MEASPRRIAVLAAAALVAILALPGVAPAQGEASVKAHYTKYEYRIPMRDGARLFTSVYVPKDASQTYPILLTRTPYSVAPYGEDRSRGELGPSGKFGESKYIFAYQDVRGRWMSEGEFVNMRPIDPEGDGIDESTDTYDTIDWLVRNVPNNSGKVGQWGISYPGFYTDAGLVNAHPALVAASPQAPVTDWFIGDDFHHHGAFFLPHAFNFLANFGRPRPKPTKSFDYLRFDHGTPDGYRFFLDLGPLPRADEEYLHGDIAFWDEMMEHGTYDPFWKARNIRQHLHDVRPAVLTVGGWFDAENLFGALETYKKIESSTPEASNFIVMGPWYHGGWNRSDGDHLGDVRFDARTAEFYRDEIEFPFFEHFLKRKQPEGFDLPDAWMFETGRNQWRRFAAWPPADARPASLFLGDDGALGFDPASGDGPDTFDEYVSDPDRPVPYIEDIAIGMTREYMVADQRFASRRPDVLVYQTPPLEEDVTLAGPVRAALTASTTGTDADWVVKLIDVYPDDYPDPDPNPTGVKMGGYQQLVRGNVMRGKFRDSYSDPKPFTPGEPTEVAFELNDVLHTFRAGHRIMVQVQSTWFPLVDLNPQRFEDIYHADDDDFHTATQRVYRSRSMPSRLEVRLLP